MEDIPEVPMSSRLWKQLFTFEGHIGRLFYFTTGVILVALKYAIDSFIASRFLQPWHIWNYFVPPNNLNIFAVGGPDQKLYLTLWAVAIPFFWVGIALTLRRIRDAGLQGSWLLLFFVPIANFCFFLYLSVAPTASAEASPRVESGAIPPRKLATPVVGVIVAATLGIGLVLLGANFFMQYAWGLFLGVPFVTGFVASWFYNSKKLHTRWETSGICTATVVVIGLALIDFRLEGVICLIMAVPLAFPFAIAGGLAARRCLENRTIYLSPPRLTACVAIVPLLMFTEHTVNLTPAVRPVVTTITINAPVSVVWKNVIAFPPLAEPHEWIFRTGIAYPIGATITGSGPGAIRRCRFSTGDFVEPITVWDENHLLAFNVASQPPALREIGLGKITTPHVDRDYMRSQYGQFRLVAVDSHHTLLEGTTWYQDYFWPQVYWRGWSDAIVHRIHLRVLEQVKQQSEAAAAKL
jgi:uncharacterized membrane protein YhaH (DUF805 family)